MAAMCICGCLKPCQSAHVWFHTRVKTPFMPVLFILVCNIVLASPLVVFASTAATTSSSSSPSVTSAAAISTTGSASASSIPTVNSTAPFPPTYSTPNYSPNVRSRMYFNVMGPPELTGSLVSQISSFGPTFPITQYVVYNNSAPFAAFSGEIVLPHRDDDVYACGDNGLRSTNELNETFVGKVLLLRRGLCAYGIKGLAAQAVGARALIVMGCSTLPPLNCGNGLIGISADIKVDIPVVYIQSSDGFSIYNYLLARNAARLANPNANVSNPVFMQIAATGALVPEERAALIAIAAATSMDQDTSDGNGMLRPWNPTEIGDMTKDPCLDRLLGVWCENSHIVEMTLDSMNWKSTVAGSNTLPKELGVFTQMRYFSMSNNNFGGAVPVEMCALTQMQRIMLDTPASGIGFTSLPACFDKMTQLKTIDLMVNALTSIPDFVNSPRMAYIDITDCQVTSLPPNLYLYPVFESIYADRNRLTSMPYVKGSRSLEKISLNGNQITTVFMGDELDNLPSLTKVDLSNNGGISGQLPLFQGGSNQLTELYLDHNQFNSSIPFVWRNNLQALKTFTANYNQIQSPINALVALAYLESAELTHNLLTADSGFEIQRGNVGAFLNSIAGSSMKTLHLDYNLISGSWDSGWLTTAYNLNTLTLSHNNITSLPPDMFGLYFTSLDLSSNSIVSWQAAANAPPSTFLYLNLQNNPKLQPSPFPDWVVTDSSVLVSSQGTEFLCPSLSSNSNAIMKLLVDPTFSKYQGCVCAKGTFGSPPTCSAVPFTAEILRSGTVKSDDIGADFVELLDLAGGRDFDAPGGSGAATNLTDRSFSDNWYGNTSRLTIGMLTSWIINRADSVQTLTLSIDVNGTASNVSLPTSTIDSIRYLTLRFHLSRNLFTAETDVLTIFEGTSQTGTRAAVLRGSDPQPLISQSSYTNTSEYQAQYGKAIQALGPNTALWELDVLAPAATISFSSRDSSGVHFFATFESHTVCPVDYFFDANYVVGGRCRPNLNHYSVSPAIQYTVYSLSSLGVLWVLINTVMVVFYWNHPIIRSASRSFLLLLLFFLLLLSTGAFFYAVVPTDDSKGAFICQARGWFCAWPLTGALAVLLAKTSRLDAIFGASKLVVKQVTDKDVLLTVGSMLIVTTSFLIAYSVMPLTYADVSEGSGAFTNQLVSSCENKSGFTVWIALLLIYIFCLMLYAAWLSWKTRSLPSKFNESAHIMAALFLLLFYGAIIVPLAFFISDTPNASLVVQGIGQSFCALLLTSIIFLPKSYMLLLVKDLDALEKGDNTMLPAGSSLGTPTNASGTNTHRGSLAMRTARASVVMNPGGGGLRGSIAMPRTTNPGVRASISMMKPNQVGSGAANSSSSSGNGAPPLTRSVSLSVATTANLVSATEGAERNARSSSMIATSTAKVPPVLPLADSDNDPPIRTTPVVMNVSSTTTTTEHPSPPAPISADAITVNMNSSPHSDVSPAHPLRVPTLNSPSSSDQAPLSTLASFIRSSSPSPPPPGESAAAAEGTTHPVTPSGANGFSSLTNSYSSRRDYLLKKLRAASNALSNAE